MTSFKVYRWFRMFFGARSFVLGDTHLVVKGPHKEVEKFASEILGDGYVEERPPSVQELILLAIGVLVAFGFFYFTWQMIRAASHM